VVPVGVPVAPAVPRQQPRAVETTNRFAKDLAREKKGKSALAAAQVDSDLRTVIDMLAADTALPASYSDHPLSGDWADHRDCHVRPDLILIYRKPDAKTLQLVRLGSHSQLGF